VFLKRETIMKKNARSLRKRIVTANMVVFSAVLLVLFSLFFAYWLSSEKKNTRENLRVIAETKANQLYDKLWSLDRLAVQLANDPYVTEVFRQNSLSSINTNTFQTDKVLNSQVIEHVIPFVLNKSVVSRICLFNNRNDFVFVGESVDYDKTRYYFNSTFFNRVQTPIEDGGRALVSPRDDPFFYKTRRQNVSRIISIIRPLMVYEKQSFSRVAWVEVQQKVSEFEKVLSDLDESITYFISSVSGDALLSNGAATDDNRQGMGTTIPIDEFGIVFKLYQDNSYLSRMTLPLGAVLLLSLLLLVFAILRTEGYIVRQLTNPLDELHKMVNSVNIRDLDFDYKRGKDIDEIEHLNQAFREVLWKLKDSIDEKIEAQTDELRSHLFALQAQMDPHFIHNILAVISSIAEEADLEDIEGICSKLSLMIRYTSQYDLTNVSLSQEVQHVENYLELMRIRYQDKFTYSILGDCESTQVTVLKFFLQPLVENCFKHGFKAVSPPWSIEILISVGSEEWTVEIRDNGAGFPLAFLDEMASLQRDASLQRAEHILKELRIGGMGLRNVFARFFLRYRTTMVFEISNCDDGQGGFVRIGAPI